MKNKILNIKKITFFILIFLNCIVLDIYSTKKLTLYGWFEAVKNQDLPSLKEYIAEAPQYMDRIWETGIFQKETALIYACRLMVETKKPYFDVIKILVDNKADINERDPNNGNTALMYLAQGNSPEIDIAIKLLIDKGADVELKNYKNKTALQFANNSNNSEIVKILYDAMPAPKEFNAKEWFKAIEKANLFLVKKMISIMKPDQIETKNEDEKTGLLVAATNIAYFNFHPTAFSSFESRYLDYKDIIDIAKIIITDGKANVNAIDNYFKNNALLYILDTSRTEKKVVDLLLSLITLLIDKGINLETKNKNDQTALDLAEKKFRKDSVVIYKTIKDAIQKEIEQKTAPAQNLEKLNNLFNLDISLSLLNKI